MYIHRDRLIDVLWALFSSDSIPTSIVSPFYIKLSLLSLKSYYFMENALHIQFYILMVIKISTRSARKNQLEQGSKMR